MPIDPMAVATDGYITPPPPPEDLSDGGALGGVPQPPTLEPLQPVVISVEKEGC